MVTRIVTVIQGFFAMLRESFIGWNRHRAMSHAASIAFFTIFSMAPLLILTVSIAGRVYSPEDIEWRIVAGVEKQAGEPAAAYVHDVMVNVERLPHSRLATGISVLVLIWGGSAMFLQLQHSINEMWGIAPKPEGIRHSLHAMLRTRLLSAGLVVAMGYLVVIALTLSTLMAMIPLRWMSGAAETMDEVMPFVRVLVVTHHLHVVVRIHVQGASPGEDSLARSVGGLGVDGGAVLGRQQADHLLFEQKRGHVDLWRGKLVNGVPLLGILFGVDCSLWRTFHTRLILRSMAGRSRRMST